MTIVLKQRMIYYYGCYRNCYMYISFVLTCNSIHVYVFYHVTVYMYVYMKTSFIGLIICDIVVRVINRLLSSF